MKAPKSVDLKEDEAEALMDRLRRRSLQEGDYALLEKLVRFSIWLQYVVVEAKINMSKLRRLLGFSSERKRGGRSQPATPAQTASDSPIDSQASAEEPKNLGGKKKAKGGVNRRIIQGLRRNG